MAEDVAWVTRPTKYKCILWMSAPCHSGYLPTQVWQQGVIPILHLH